MTDHDWDSRVEIELARMLELPQPERAKAIAELASTDATLAERVESWARWLGERGLVADEGVPERLGEYRLIRRIGGGGMGIVWLAEQESLGREVALKVLRPDLGWFDEARARFRREAEAVASLQHPNLVTIHAVGEERGTPYLAMEWIDGRSLASVIQDGDLAPEFKESDFGDSSWEKFCIRIASDVARGLEHAHAHGIVHRDVKPSNVMIDRRGRVVLLDFGLAHSESADDLTRSGAQLGSLPYMSPEQVAGQQVDARSDVWSLGVTLFELLTQKRPFRGVTAAKIREEIRAAHLPRLAALGVHVTWETQVVVETALAPEPERRYRDASSMRSDLEAILRHGPIQARPASVLRRGIRLVQRRPAKSALVALAVVVAVAPLLLWIQGRHATQAILIERDLAEESFDSAVKAVDDLLIELSKGLDYTPAGREAAHKITTRAARFYEDWLLKRDDPLLRARCANSLTLLARAWSRIGRYEEARTAARRAIDQANRILETKTTANPLVLRAWARAAHADASRQLGDTASTRSMLQGAIDDVVAAQEAGAPSQTHGNLGIFYRRMALMHVLAGEVEDASRVFGESIEAFERLPDEERSRSFAMEHAHALVASAFQDAKTSRFELGEQRLERARVLLARVYARSGRDDVRARELEGFICATEGWLALQAKRYSDAVRHLVEARKFRVEFCERVGYTANARSQLMNSLQWLSDAEIALDKNYDRAADAEIVELAKRHGVEDLETMARGWVATAHHQLGRDEDDARKRVEHFQKCIEIGLPTLDDQPDGHALARHVADSMVLLGNGAVDAKEYDVARRYYERAIPIHERLADKGTPERAQRARREIRNMSIRMAHCDILRGAFEQAKACLQPVREAMLARKTRQPVIEMLWGRLECALGEHEVGLRRILEALRPWGRSMRRLPPDQLDSEMSWLRMPELWPAVRSSKHGEARKMALALLTLIQRFNNRFEELAGYAERRRFYDTVAASLRAG